MASVWLASFPDLPNTWLLAVAFPYAAVVWFLRRSITRPGIVLAALVALLMLLASPVFAFYLFASVIRAIGMPLLIAFLGVLIVAANVVLLVSAMAMNRGLRRDS
jgi:hypothetical protein